MVQLVNGYTCHNPAQVALAKRGINPAASVPKQAAGAVTAQALTTQPPSNPESSTAITDFSRVGRGRFVDLIA